ncbi:MAG: hypothetical protein B7Y36_03390 [Novosphingobium sp. 28-62-57]|uniref:DUF2939 domain-containing protein n=1 Tax=Novosphingobium sp. 28-62-57 TaxID=1970409 RepID=UPI000BD11ECA|nr:DUF2939 domain-containing protein [Novosphingobium sp. 28-62-57]OYZ12556.1 MAG: hypothetical protein B7Y36_03390 [Novosphingobium sp. 28-62-57]
MRNRVILIVGGLLFIFGIAYFGSPYLAARNLQEAAKSVDADALESSVDFPAVRDSLKSQLNAVMVKKMSEDSSMKSNPFVGLGLMMAPAIIDRMVDSFVTPDGIAAIARGQKPNEGKSDASSRITYFYSWVNIDRFRVWMRNTEEAKDGPSLLFERRGLFSWKLIRIEISDLMNGASASPAGSTSSLLSTTAPTPAVPPTPQTLSTTLNPMATDDDLKNQWGALNEECRGGQHTPEDEICSSRDRMETVLQSRGWCWAYSDTDIVPADFNWHKCDATRP